MPPCRCIGLTVFLSVLLAADGQAHQLLKRPARPDPAEQVPALIKTLQSDPDDRKRASAAEDLRSFDGKAFPDIVPALIEALKNDPSIPVRIQAATSIGKIRPITPGAAYALDQAVQNDSALRVRAVARTTLIEWSFFHGVRPSRPAEAPAAQTEEPPLAEPLPGAKDPPPSPRPANTDTQPRSRPPLIGQSYVPAKSDRLFPLLTGRIKPERPKPPVLEGPALNPPR